jgi:uncharacterized protein
MPTDQNTAGDALGIGLDFPIRIGHRGGWIVARHEEKVRQSIWAILSTAKGERVMRPEFGCDLHTFVFATLDTNTLTLIKSSVREALIRWEPRIEVKEVAVERANARSPEKNIRRMAAVESGVLIKVSYLIRLTNSPANLVFPFYLQHGI